MNGPWKFLTARKILPLLDLPAKFKRSKLLAARKVHGMLAKTRHPYFLYRQFYAEKPFSKEAQ